MVGWRILVDNLVGYRVSAGCLSLLAVFDNQAPNVTKTNIAVTDKAIVSVVSVAFVAFLELISSGGMDGQNLHSVLF